VEGMTNVLAVLYKTRKLEDLISGSFYNCVEWNVWQLCCSLKCILGHSPQVILVDGNGVLHPRGMLHT